MNSIIIVVIGFRKLVLANEKYQYLLNSFSKEFLLSGKTQFTPQDNYCFTVYGLADFKSSQAPSILLVPSDDTTAMLFPASQPNSQFCTIHNLAKLPLQ